MAQWRKPKKLTPNLQHTLRNQRRKFTDLLIDIIPPSSLNSIMALPPSSFHICKQGLFIPYWLLSLLLRSLLTPLSPVSPRVCCRRRNMGRWGELDLLSLVLRG